MGDQFQFVRNDIIEKLSAGIERTGEKFRGKYNREIGSMIRLGKAGVNLSTVCKNTLAGLNRDSLIINGFSRVPLWYNDHAKTVTFGAACGEFKYQENFKIKWIAGGQSSKTIEFAYKGKEETIGL